MQENRERKYILPYNIDHLKTNRSASGRPCAEPLAVPKRHSPSYAGGTGQGIGIVERKGDLQNGDEETGKPFIDEKK
jgi:hypothetical protein